jgi:hypothetical protein
VLEWPSTVFCHSLSFFCLRFSISWVTSSLVLSILIHLSLYL